MIRSVITDKDTACVSTQPYILIKNSKYSLVHAQFYLSKSKYSYLVQSTNVSIYVEGIVK